MPADRSFLTDPLLSRRDFSLAIGGWAALPAFAYAQSKPLIGYLGPESRDRYRSRLNAFYDGLREAGYVEGDTVSILYAWAEGDYGRLPELARDLAGQRVDLIVAPGGAEVGLAAKSATSTIPVVFEMGGDPVALGVVASLSRPGGNLTGVSSLSVEVSRKRLEFMRQLRPDSRAFAVATNPRSPTSNSQLKNLYEAASMLGLELIVQQVSAEGEFSKMFSAVAQGRSGGLVFSSDPYFAYRSDLLAELAVRYRVPAITQSRDFPLAGGLMSYGGDFSQSHRGAGIYTGRILRGERPAELPVQRVTKVELFINLKAGEALGIEFPPSILASADKIIE